VESLWKLSGTPLSMPMRRMTPDWRSCSSFLFRVGQRAGAFWQ
jgi:hypothetical protein